MLSVISSNLVLLCRRTRWLLCLLVLSGCAQQPAPDGAYTSEGSRFQSAQAALAQAEAETSPQRDHLMLQAAVLFDEGGHTAPAVEALEQIDAGTLDNADRIRYTLIYARLAMEQDNLFLAGELLEDSVIASEEQSLSPAQRREWHRLRGQLFALTGRDAESLVERVAQAALLDDQGARKQVHNALWQTLSAMPAAALGSGLSSTPDPVLQGWYQLALTTRSAQGNIQRQVELINHWRQVHARHPAARTPPTNIERAIAASTDLPGRLAVLLPLSGDLAQAGKSLQEGMLSSYYQALETGTHLPGLRFYDSESADPLALYQQAVQDGADLVLGPLRKDRVQTLINAQALPVPVLALNVIEETNSTHPNLYQFGLSVNDEVHQLAERAWRDGHRSVLVLTPDSAWGHSTADAFRREWQAQGGRLMEVSYNTQSLDYSPEFKPVLLITHSEERAARLQRVLGQSVEYTPRHRRDIEAILLASHPQQARQIKPTLDFLYAGDLPVYATSQIYDGESSPSDRDLEGIRFTATPWMIPTLTRQAIENADHLAPAYRSLFAMGVDSYRLHQWLSLMANLPSARLNGLTGQLALGDNNRIIRTLPWARFSGGRAVLAGGRQNP